MSSGRILLRCFGYLHPYWRLTVGAYLIILVVNALALTIPQLIRWIVDEGIGTNGTFLAQGVPLLPGASNLITATAVDALGNQRETSVNVAVASVWILLSFLTIREHKKLTANLPETRPAETP